jgi:hypothetical protein
MAYDTERRIFQYLNRYFMVPVFRLGLGAFIANPFSGYIMVIKTIGHKTGKERYTPTDYTIQNGNIYCVAGFARRLRQSNHKRKVINRDDCNS